MHQIVIIPNNSSANTALFYTTPEKAEIARDNIQAKIKEGGDFILNQKDEFGVTLIMAVKNISYAMYIDMDKQAQIQTFLRGGPVPTKEQSQILGVA